MSTTQSFLSSAAVLLATVSGTAAKALVKGGLDISVYNSGAKGIFAVSSEIVSGPSEVVLIDAQMGRADAEALVARIKATHKRLKAVYVSQSDPDFYFGLETIRAAFPRVRVFATPGTIAEINATKAGKLAYWGPKLKENAPKSIVVPEALKGDTLTVDGESLRIVGLDGPTPNRTFVWIPSQRAVIGGTAVAANEHVFLADTKSPQSRDNWRKTLARIQALRPVMVVPGHYHLDPDGSAPRSLASVRFTRAYLNAFEAEAAKSAGSDDLIRAMRKRYPGLAGGSSLEISAKVVKGEMKWPAE